MTTNSNFESYLNKKMGLAAPDAKSIAAKVPSKKVKKGEFLLQDGQICKHSFFVESGLLRMYTINSDGKASIVQFAPENWIISDRSSIYFNKPSNYIIDAVEDTHLYSLGQDTMNEINSIQPDFHNNNEILLHKHVMHLQNRITQLLGATAEERYLDFISLYPDLLTRVPQWMIASYLGITPESLSRIRRDLARKNFRS